MPQRCEAKLTFSRLSDGDVRETFSCDPCGFFYNGPADYRDKNERFPFEEQQERATVHARTLAVQNCPMIRELGVAEVSPDVKVELYIQNNNPFFRKS